jgi:hypothetical protein
VYNPVGKAVKEIVDKKLWMNVDKLRSLSTELSTPKTQYNQGLPILFHNFTAPTTITTIYIKRI